jgi:ribosomal protein S18 acetylase RimI-like enzyme
VAAPGNTLLIARDEQGAIVGTLTLVVYPTPGATLGYIEDVVVDEPARGRGIGEALVDEGLRIAAERGAVQTDLLSGNHRQAAIRLYRRVGFEHFETNVWRFTHQRPPT